METVMEEWNKNNEFWKEYTSSNLRITIRRLKTLDGHSLGPDEEPPALPIAASRRVDKSITAQAGDWHYARWPFWYKHWFYHFCENVGLLGLTRVGSCRVVQISAGFMIFFATLGKFGVVFASTPFPMYAALYCVLFGLVGSVGISFLQFKNMNSMRNLIITGVSLFLEIPIPQFFNEYLTPNSSGLVHTNAGWGLITKERKNIDPAVAPFAKGPGEIEGLREGATLLEVVKKIKPHVLLGLSGVGSIFTAEYEAAWAVPIFVKLLGSPSDDVREQVVWALGNVAGDSPRCRDLVLGHGALLPLLSQLNEHAKLSMLRNATWTLSNFCRGKPQPPFDQVKPALPALERLIHSNDEEVLTDACWALSYLSDGTNDKIQAVIDANVCGRLVELLLHPSPSVLIPALRTVGNIVTGDDMQTQCIISHQALPCLLNLLTNNYKKSIKKEACWTISNITAGNKEQIQCVIEANIIAPLVHLLQNGEFDIKKEAAWAISNATSGGAHEQIKYLVSQGCIKPLCDLLICPDPRIVTVCLEGLENILKVGEADKNLGNTDGVNLYAQMIDDAEGLEKIENLQSHDNTEIYEKAVKILETYWLEEDDETMPTGDAQGFGGELPAVPTGGFNFSS